MKQSKLLDYHVSKSTKIELGLFENTLNFSNNDYGLILYPNRKTFRQHILPQLNNNNNNNTNATDSILVISCMDNELLRNNFINIVPCKNYPQLIKILQDLYNCNENSPYFDNATTTTTTTIQILDKHINYILIHNISSFFYDLQIVDQYNYQSLGFEQFNQPDKSPPPDQGNNQPYGKTGKNTKTNIQFNNDDNDDDSTKTHGYYNLLLTLVKKINRKYNCLVVLTSYDIEFDSGLVGSYLYNPNHELQRYTKLPIPFITRFTSTIHISNDANAIHVLNNSTTATAATYPISDKIEQNKRKHISHPKWQMISKNL